MSWNAATSGCEFNVMSSLTLTTEADRRICGMHLRHKYFFPLRENTWFRRQRRHGFPLAQFLAGSRRPSNALNDLCKGLSDPVVLSSEGPWLPDRGSHQQPKLLDPRRPHIDRSRRQGGQG
ncbi:hypothetical protein EV363DRAFT_1262469 [Boletus edulis]|nr:hypothetical protein EV363DRAFT_1262469 [Boletus edulis]